MASVTPYDMIYTLIEKRTTQPEDSVFKDFEFVHLPIESFELALKVTEFFTLMIDKKFYTFSCERSELHQTQGIVKIVYHYTDVTLLTTITQLLTSVLNKPPKIVSLNDFPRTIMVY